MNNPLKIFSDGGSRGNPGEAASAFVVEKGGKLIYSDAAYLGKATNNVAEYNGVIRALRWLEKNKNLINGDTYFILDSELIVRQINGRYRVRDADLKILYAVVKKLLDKIGQKIIFESVSRDKNKKADFLVNQKLNEVP